MVTMHMGKGYSAYPAFPAGRVPLRQAGGWGQTRTWIWTGAAVGTLRILHLFLRFLRFTGGRRQAAMALGNTQTRLGV